MLLQPLWTRSVSTRSVLDLAHKPMTDYRAEHEREARFYNGKLSPKPLDSMVRVRNMLTPSTGNATLSFPLVTCDGKSADLGSITLAKLLVPPTPARFRPQNYTNFVA